MFKDELNAGSGDITVWINSPGGDCVAAAQIYNMLANYKGNVTVKIDGIAASAASVIAMAGHTVLMSPVSMMMIHNPATVAFGDHTEMAKAIEMLEGVKDSIYKLKRPYRKNASFIMNDATLAQIRKLKDNNGQYLWQPSYQANEPDKILGYNIRTSAFAPTDAIAFGDYKYYNIGDRGSRSFKQLNELFAGNGMIGYVAKERVDGLLILPEAVKILGLKAETTTTATK